MSAWVEGGSPTSDRRLVQFPQIARRTSFLEAGAANGRRAIALIEPTATSHVLREAIARDVLTAAEMVIADADGGDADLLIRHAFGSANHVIRERNQRQAGSDPLRRVFFGLVMAVLDGERLTIGVAAPGQALIVQDRHAYAFPALAGFEPHGCDGWTAAPLGMFVESAPAMYETQARGDDLLVLGGRGLATSLDAAAIERLLDGPECAVESGIIAMLTSSGRAGDAIVIRVGDLTRDEPVLPLSDCEPIVADRQIEPLPADASAPARRPAGSAPAHDRWHTRAIEASERLLARKAGPALPLEGQRRAKSALGASSVRRYQPRHGLSPELKSRLPRASQFPFRAVATGLAVVLVLSTLAVGYNVRQARASRQSTYLAAVRTQFAKAQHATNSIDGLKFVRLAESALRSAESNGASGTIVHRWHGDISALSDSLLHIHRFSAVAPLVEAPKSGTDDPAEVVEAGGALYVVSGAVYLVDVKTATLTKLLGPGSVVSNRTARALVNGCADGDDLVVSDGVTLFRWNPTDRWTAEPLPTTALGPWTSPMHGAFMGNYYVLDAGQDQIFKFSQDNLSAAPTAWLESDNQTTIDGAVDMALDGSIRVLLQNGTIETLFKGEAQGSAQVSFEPGAAIELALDGGVGMTYLYVLERGKDATRLIRFNPATGEKIQFQAADDGQVGYNAAAAAAFAKATDVAVNESAGFAAFLSGNQLWIATLDS